MNATENRLKFEMEDAKRTLDWIEQERTNAEQQAEKCSQRDLPWLQAYYEKQADKWKHQKRETYLWYYRAKHELKTLKAQTNAD